MRLPVRWPVKQSSGLARDAKTVKSGDFVWTDFSVFSDFGRILIKCKSTLISVINTDEILTKKVITFLN